MYTLYWDIIIGDLYLKYCFVVEHKVIDKPLFLSSLPPSLRASHPSLPSSISPSSLSPSFPPSLSDALLVNCAVVQPINHLIPVLFMAMEVKDHTHSLSTFLTQTMVTNKQRTVFLCSVCVCLFPHYIILYTSPHNNVVDTQLL